MALTFKLRGLAETFVDEIECPECGINCNDDTHFSTELTKVTFEGIIVVVQCKSCHEIFVPDYQRLGIINPDQLKNAVKQDSVDTGEPILDNIYSVKLTAEKLNAQRKGALH